MNDSDFRGFANALGKSANMFSLTSAATELLGHHEAAAATGGVTRVASPIRFRC
jgi:hypothetical protein